MEKIIEMQVKRTEILMKALEITKALDNPLVTDRCKDIRSYLIKSENLLQKLRTGLEKKTELCNDMEELTKQCNECADRVEEINFCVFPDQQNQSTLPETCMQPSTNGQNYNPSEVSPCPSAWANGALDTPLSERRNFGQSMMAEEPIHPCIRHIQPYEMETVPTYMKGRLTCENLNSFIETLNSVLKKKYSVVKLKRKNVKKKDLIQYCNWKAQEEEYGMTGQIFFTPEDLLVLGNLKMDKSADKMTQILRHTKRLRQSRVIGKKVLYILI